MSRNRVSVFVRDVESDMYLVGRVRNDVFEREQCGDESKNSPAGKSSKAITSFQEKKVLLIWLAVISLISLESRMPEYENQL